MTDIAELERWVTALEAANNVNTQTLNWIVGTLGCVAGDMAAVKDDVKVLKDDVEILKGDMAAVKTDVGLLNRKVDDLTKSLPSIIVETMRNLPIFYLRETNQD